MRQPTSPQKSRNLGPFLALLSISAFFSSWTGVAIGGANVADYALVALLVATAILATSGAVIPIPIWMVAPTLGSLLILIVDTFLRPTGSWESGWTFFARAILSTTVVGVALSAFSANANNRARLITVVQAWIFGISVSAVAALMFSRGIATLDFVNSVSLDADDRPSGLTSHPNALAFSLVIALPTCVYLAISEKRRVRSAIWATLVVINAVSLYEADSRIGIVVGFAAALTMVLRTLAAKRLWLLLLPLTIAGIIVIAVRYVPGLLAETRLAEGQGDLSNLGRSQLNSDAWDSFLANPLVGSGFAQQGGVSQQLQLLSAGGLVLFGVFYVFIGSVAWFIGRPTTALAVLGLVVLGTTVAFGLFQPTVTERSTYWIPLCVMLMASGGWRKGPDSEPSEELETAQTAATEHQLLRGRRGH